MTHKVVKYMPVHMKSISLFRCFIQPCDLASYCQEFHRSGNEPRTCLDYLCKGRTLDGVYNIYPTGFPDYSLTVYCDQTTDGGGWTVSYTHKKTVIFLLLFFEYLKQVCIYVLPKKPGALQKTGENRQGLDQKVGKTP